MRRGNLARAGMFLALALGASDGAIADDSRRLERAIEAFDAKRLEEARELLESLLADEPLNHRALWNRGLLAMHEERHDEALDWFNRALAVEEDAAEYHLWKGYANARKVERVGILRKPFVAARIRKSFERAVALDPQSIPARKALMRYYEQAPFFLGGSSHRAAAQAEAIAEFESLQPGVP